MLTLVAQMTAPPPPPVLVSPSPSASAPASASPFPSASPSPSPPPAASPSALAVTPSSIAFSPAQQRVLTVSGATAPLSVSSDRRLVTTAIDQAAMTVTVTATQATGNDTLHIVDANGAAADVPVRVAFAAGTIVPNATLKVTGSPVDPSWLAAQVASLIARLTTALPGAQTTIAAVTPAPAPLVPGTQTQFNVPVAIAGGDQYFDVSGATMVTVQNVPMDAFLPSVLFYDDDPERVNADGVLYRGTLDASRAARLYFYHDDGPAPRRVVVVLSTQSQDPTSVQVIDATAGPNIDVMSVGHASSKNFLQYEPRGQGTIVDVDGAPVVLHDLAMQYRQGVAGTVGMRVLSGGPLTVTVIAVSPGVDPLALLAQPVLPSDGHHRTGVFAINDYGTAALTYNAGGPDATLVYGDREPTPRSVDPHAPGHDYGDYGVLWNVNFTLRNPTNVPAQVYLYERPIGGVVRSSFLAGDKLIDMGCVRVSKPYEIAAYTLAPNQTYSLPVRTMTDGGSNYPLELGLTQTPPETTLPPISSADGCFPKPQASPSASPVPSPSPRGAQQ